MYVIRLPRWCSVLILGNKSPGTKCRKEQHELNLYDKSDPGLTELVPLSLQKKVSLKTITSNFNMELILQMIGTT